MISASSLTTGAPVYLLRDGRWTGRLQDAAVWATEEQRDAALAGPAIREDLVCDAYAFMVLLKDGPPADGVTAKPTIDPLSARESIRAQGPTIAIGRPDSGAGAET